MTAAPLHGHRILVVEDDIRDANRFSRLLREAGADVVGPADSVAEAARLVAEDGLSAAWLDVWIDDNTKPVWPVATLLSGKGIPFVFCTQMPDDVDRNAWPGHPVIPKRVFTEHSQKSIIATIAGLIAGRPTHPVPST